MKVVIIGAGNMATFLGYALQSKGVEIVQMYNRNIDSGYVLADALNVPLIDNLAKIDHSADAYLLCIADDALQEIASKMPKVQGTVIHCSGTQSLKAIASASEKQAVIWPIYSIKKDNLPQQNSIPLVIEGSDATALQTARFIAEKISSIVVEVNHQQRKKLHLTAVLVNNFTNHLLSIAEKICDEEALSFEVLKPIIHQTLAQIETKRPSETQTGPAIRGDEATMAQHLDLLKLQPHWQDIYKSISDSIQKMNR